MTAAWTPETMAKGVSVELIAKLWRDHWACEWLSDGTNVRWSCGVIRAGPIHMQPTTRDRHLAALVMTQIQADAAVEAAAVVLAGDGEVEWGVRWHRDGWIDVARRDELTDPESSCRRWAARRPEECELVSRRVGPWEVTE